MCSLSSADLDIGDYSVVVSCPWASCFPREVTSLMSGVVLSRVLCGVGWNVSSNRLAAALSCSPSSKWGKCLSLTLSLEQLDFAELPQNLEFHVPPSSSSINLLPMRRQIQSWTEEHKPSHLLNSLTAQQFWFNSGLFSHWIISVCRVGMKKIIHRGNWIIYDDLKLSANLSVLTLAGLLQPLC